MLHNTHTVSVTRQGTVLTSSRPAYFHTPHIDADVTVHPVGQPLHAFLEDNGVPALDWRKGDVVTVLTSLIDGQPYAGNITTWTVDWWGKRGQLHPYYEVQLTGTGR